MSALPCTTTAGRHALDLARARERNLRRDLRDSARERLAQAFQTNGLRVEPHFGEPREEDLTLAVSLRLASVRADQILVNSVMDDQGWIADCKRISKVNAFYDVRRVRHERTGALLTVIIKAPRGEIVEWEAA